MAGVFLWALSSGPVAAQCAPDPAMDGEEVVCDGVDFSGFASNEDSLDFIVTAGAGIRVRNQQAVVLTGNSSRFENNGLIRGGAGPFHNIEGLVQLGNVTGTNTEDTPSITGENFGQIIVARINSQTGFSHPALDIGSNVASFTNRHGALIENQFWGTAVYLNSEFSHTFVNEGTIRSGERQPAIVGRPLGSGISNSIPPTRGAAPLATVVNAATGVIEAQSISTTNIGVSGIGRVINQGIIRGITGVSLSGAATLINEAGGLIEGSGTIGQRVLIAGQLPTRLSLSPAVQAFSTEHRPTIINDGVLRGAGAAIFGDSFSLMNNGRISGSIQSSQLSFGPNEIEIVNAGEIEGDVVLGFGNDSFTSVGDAAVIGRIDGGEDFDIVTYADFVGEINLANVVNFEQLNISTPGIVSIGVSASIFNTFSELFIEEGFVIVDTEIDLNTTILENGILGGNGTITGDVTNFGAIAPGTSIGAFNINGDLTLNPSSILEVEFNDTGNDLLTVNGDVSIDEATLLIRPLDADITSVRSLNFLMANSVNGEFSNIILSGFSGFTEITANAPGLLSVTLTPQIAIAPALSANAASTARYLNGLIVAGVGTSGSDDVITSLFTLSGNRSLLENALLTLQPEAFSAAAAIGVEQAFLATDLVRGRAANADARKNGKYYWLSGTGGFARYEGDLIGGGTSSFEIDSRGVIGGVEIVRGDALVGAYGGRIDSAQEFRSALAETEADGFVLGGYGAWSSGALNTSLSLGYVFGDVETHRVVPFLNEQLRSDFGLDVFTTQAQSRYDIKLDKYTLAPVAGLTYIRTDRDNFSESAGSAALSVSDKTDNFLYLDISGEAARRFVVNNDTVVHSKISAGWRYETLGHSIEVDAGLDGNGILGLSGSAADFERSRLVVGGNISVNLDESIVLFAEYSGEFGDDYSQNRVNGGLSVSF